MFWTIFSLGAPDGRDGVNTVKRERNIFSIWRKGTMSKTCAKIEDWWFDHYWYTIRLGNEQATGIFFNSLNIPRLTDEQKLSCEDSITEEECVKTLQSFQGNKAPGNDGLSIEFYSKLWEIISEPFVNCVNEI